MNEHLAWDDLRLVLAIGQAGSLSGAARMLGISHATVFRRIGRIEARLGVRLFERARTGYTATAAGEEMLSLAAGIDTDVADLERRLAGRDLRPSGTVRVTTTDTLVDLLMPMLAAFRGAFPAVLVELVVSNELFDLRRRDADVAIRPTATPPESLVGRRLGPIAMAVYAAEGVVETREAVWIGPDDTLSHLSLARWLATTGKEDRVVFRANSLVAMQAAAGAGVGCAVLPCFMGDAATGLVRCGAPIESLASELWLLTHPDLRQVTRIRAVLDFMADAVRPHLPALAGAA